MAQLHQLHIYISTLARYDASWAIRDLNRFSSALLSQAGIKIQDESRNAGEEKEAEEAFSRGESVPEMPNGSDEVSAALEAQRGAKAKDQLQQGLKAILLAQGAIKPSSAPTSTVFESLGKWPALPGWAEEATSSKLRDPPSDDEASAQSVATSYGSGPRAAKQASMSRMANRTQAGSSRSKREKVVLVPTESDPAFYAKPEQPRSRGLQEFLQSDEEEEEAELPQPALAAAEAEDTEESSSEEETTEEESEEESSDEPDEDGQEQAAQKRSLLGEDR